MFNETCIQAGQRVLREEAEAILALVPTIDEKFARQSLISYVKTFVETVKRLKPDLVVSAYTISAPNFKAPDWVNLYPVDFHAKYVSRHLSGPESQLADIGPLIAEYAKWVADGRTSAIFSPIIASFDRKSGNRLEAELKIVGDTQSKIKPQKRRVEYFEYNYLLAPGEKQELDPSAAAAISRMLGGTLH